MYTTFDPCAEFLSWSKYDMHVIYVHFWKYASFDSQSKSMFLKFDQYRKIHTMSESFIETVSSIYPPEELKIDVGKLATVLYRSVHKYNIIMTSVQVHMS